MVLLFASYHPLCKKGYLSHPSGDSSFPLQLRNCEKLLLQVSAAKAGDVPPAYSTQGCSSCPSTNTAFPLLLTKVLLLYAFFGALSPEELMKKTCCVALGAEAAVLGVV